MKIRTILVAATVIVILAGFGAKLRIDQWQKATNAAYAQLESDRRAFSRANARSVPVPLAGGPQVITGWQEARNRETQTYQILTHLLENKPFGIPLTAGEQTVLDNIRVELARRDP